MSESSETPKIGTVRIIRNSESLVQPETTLIQDNKDKRFKPLEELRDPLQKSKEAGKRYGEKIGRTPLESPPTMVTAKLDQDRIARIIK